MRSVGGDVFRDLWRDVATTDRVLTDMNCRQMANHGQADENRGWVLY